MVGLLLTNVIFPLKIEGSKETTKSLEKMYASLGKVSTDERRVFYIFLMTALAWMSSKALVLIPFLEGLTDYAIAVFAALAIFITRSEKRHWANRLENNKRTALGNTFIIWWWFIYGWCY